MGVIRLLDSNTIDRIAAGEVVERPSSVVKELVENALDAGASGITVEIEDGGKKLIRVTDNGGGISREDIPTAFISHATSKLTRLEDLDTISSLGFRGEALSTIASVSRVELITRSSSDITGTRYVIWGGEEKANEEVGAPEGSTFLVRDLFYNTPARSRFLKSDMSEAGDISSLMEQIALSHPQTAFRFISGGQVRLQTTGNGKLRDVIYNVYGRDVARGLSEVSFENEFVRISGYAGKPELSRGNRSFENYYVNGRYVRNNILTRAIEDAYKGFLMQHRFPFVTLILTLPGDEVDVNVHPRKLEVRFLKGPQVYEAVFDAVRASLTRQELIPRVSPGKETKQNNSEAKQNGIETKQNDSAAKQNDSETIQNDSAAKQNDSAAIQNDSAAKQKYPVGEPVQDGGPSGKMVQARESVEIPVQGTGDADSRPDRTDGSGSSLERAPSDQRKSSLLCSVREDRAGYGNAPAAFGEAPRTDDALKTDGVSAPGGIPVAAGKSGTGGDSGAGGTPAAAQTPGAAGKSGTVGGSGAGATPTAAQTPGAAGTGLDASLPVPDALTKEEESLFSPDRPPGSAAPQQLSLFEEKLLDPASRSRHRLIGQLFDTYWLVEFDNSFYIIDQHAAHEKVFYERFVRQFREQTIQSQYLNPPLILTLTMEEEYRLKANQKYFEDFGFEIEPYGGREYCIRAVPLNLYGFTEEEAFHEMLDHLAAEKAKDPVDVFAARLATMACKAAVKGNSRLSAREADQLIDELLGLEEPYHCPHGRPTIISMSKTDIEKKFHRIV